MPNQYELYEHEVMRWGYMTRSQLRTRLGRIRKPEKLQCFIRLAMENESLDLLEAAYSRAAQLGFSHLVPYSGGPVPETMLEAMNNRRITNPLGKPFPSQTFDPETQKILKKKPKKRPHERVIRFKKKRR